MSSDSETVSDSDSSLPPCECSRCKLENRPSTPRPDHLIDIKPTPPAEAEKLEQEMEAMYRKVFGEKKEKEIQTEHLERQNKESLTVIVICNHIPRKSRIQRCWKSARNLFEQTLPRQVALFQNQIKRIRKSSPAHFSKRDKYGPMMVSDKIWNLFDEDVSSLQDWPTVNSIWRLLHKKIGDYNWSKAKKDQICLLHPKLFHGFQSAFAEGTVDLDFELLLNEFALEADTTNFQCVSSYHNNQIRTIFVPIVDINQFSLLVFRKEKDTLFIDNVDSSMQLVQNRLLGRNETIFMASIFLKPFKTVYMESKPNILMNRQETMEDSGIHLILNVEALLKPKFLSFKSGRSFSQISTNQVQYTAIDILEARIRFERELKQIKVDQMRYELKNDI